MQGELKEKDSALKDQEREVRSRESQIEKLNTEMIL